MIELISKGCIRLELPQQDRRLHDTFLACPSALLAHVATFQDDCHADGWVFLSESLQQHIADVMPEPFLYLETSSAVVHHATYLRNTEYLSALARDVRKVILSEERPRMMFAKAVEIAAVEYHAIADDAVLTVGKGGYPRLLVRVVTSEYLFAHASYPVWRAE